ncbi:conserved Plasmodium protein, unknown function [Plasmodium gallinaceum]|uniref:Uncharacterized protein n=1 Tax=Plasmodium gallinaceum TaxID=5849 RepID=A0A1J1GUP3_PLAGA|nr:conserved Plasmodium protein, unknown function [Plasmodium gallinaceum]CRG95963.1 conserved Plasmodium protein, unknown function [Plasmodium gallinaceum]
MVTKKNVSHEKIISPVISKLDIKPVKIKNLYELNKELKNKIYTNIYSYNTLCDGIFICRGINGITGTKNSGKTSLSSHISVNLYFNDLLHFFHLFYSTYFAFENFLKNRNIEIKFFLQSGNNLNKIKKEFNSSNKTFYELNELIKYFTLLFIEKYDKKIDGSEFYLNNNKKVNESSNLFSKRKVIYLDLDNSFYIERYKNMIYSSIDKIKKLMNTYMGFCSERHSFLFLLLLENNDLKKNLFHIYKNYSNEYFLFINLFNHYLKKYIYDITFLDVFKNLQILKIFSFNELINVVNYIYQQLQNYSVRSTNYFNKYVSSDLGILVVDNLNYLYKSYEFNHDLNNELINLLKILSKISTKYKICVLITNNENKYLKKYDKYFNKIYSKYIYNRIVVRFINKKFFFEYNYSAKKQKQFQNKSITNSSSEESFYEIGENDEETFYEKRYNLRYIKVKKKNKINICSFEINEHGVQTLLD